MFRVMKRTILAILIAIVAAILIAVFQLMDLETLISVLETDPIGNVMVLGAFLFAILTHPYTFLLSSVYMPIAALAAASFIAGLVAKDRMKMLPISIIVLVIFLIGYIGLALGSGLSDVSTLLTELQSMVIDIGLAWALLFFPGLIGATITAE